MVQQSQYRIPLFKVFMSETAKTNASSVLDSGYIGQGQKVEDFELQLRRYFGSPYVNTVNSATSGIHLALHAIKTIKDIDNGVRDEILTTPLTCVATNMPILANGLKIKWVDVNEDDCNINIDDLEFKLGAMALRIENHKITNKETNAVAYMEKMEPHNEAQAAMQRKAKKA